MNSTNEALNAEKKFKTSVEEAQEYIENFDILETINNVGNDEVFTPVKVCQQMLDVLPNEVWHNPDYKWLNPCDKNGVFLREIALRLDAGLSKWENDTEKRRKHILQKMIFSIGLTKFTSQVSRRTVYYCSQANRKFDGKVDQDGNSINGYAIGNGEWFDSEQGNILTPITEHTFNKGKCIYCGTAEKDKDGKPGRYSDPNQLEHYAYEFIHVEDIEKHLQKRFFGGKKMKFDIIIGNPPYQLQVNEGGKGLGAIPLYHKFIQQAILLQPKYLSMIIPSRWFAGGVGLNDFRLQMLNSKKISFITDYMSSRDCFPNFDINGGVCYFLYDQNYNSTQCNYTNITNKIRSTEMRLLNEFEIFIRSNEAIDIINKVRNKMQNNIVEIVSSQTPYGIISNYRGEKEPFEGSLKYFASDGESYVSPSAVKKDIDTINTFRLMLPKITSEHAGIPDKNGKFKVLTPMKILNPLEICSQSYLVVGPFKNKIEAENAKRYFETKFLRFLLFVSLPGMNISKEKFRFIPMQNFSNSTNDDQLFKKYDLTDKEISYISSLIKDM